MLRLKENGIKIFEEIKEAVANLNDLKKVAIRFNDIGYQYYKLGARIEHIEVLTMIKLFINVDSLITILYLLIKRSVQKHFIAQLSLCYLTISKTNVNVFGLKLSVILSWK